MSNEMLDAACAYGRMGWSVFPLHTMVNGACSCGKACSSPAKHPRTQRGFKDATTDPAQIRRFWNRYPDANIGISTGSGLVVIDIDGEQGAKEFKELVAAHGPPPATLVCRTGNGFHLFYLTRPDSPSVRSSAVGKVHIRGEGGYVVASPSRHASGRIYTWIKKLPVATLPDWLRQWSQGYEISGNNLRPGSLQPARGSAATGLTTLGQAPAYLQNRQSQQPDVAKTLSETLRPQYSASEQARLISALAAIPADQYETWFQVGMALKDLGWERSDGSDVGFLIWNEWSQTCPEKYALAACESKWNSFRRSGVSIGTLYHLAQRHGWNGIPQIGGPGNQTQQHQQLNGHANGVNGQHALPAAFLQPVEGGIFFPDRTEKGKPLPTYTNAIVAVEGAGVVCEHDLFHNRMLVGGEPLAQWNQPELSDNVVMVIRTMIRQRFGFDPGKINTGDACQFLCIKNRFDPVLDYLDELIWDGVPRLDHWMPVYLGATDNEYTRAVSRLSLIAAVRRARQPATKFDQIIVLEGPTEGRGKSTAIKILAGPENFSDQKILGVDDRKQQELTEGVWLYEIAELTGMNRAEVEHVKAFASRDTDRARAAYARFQTSQKRRTVFFATTNRTDDYLISDTGNRRFWPVLTRHIDLDGLARDRDQLWAEAAAREAKGETHLLPERLWEVAAAEQSQRMTSDAWLDPITNYINLKGVADYSLMDVLCDNQFLRLEPSSIGQREQNRAAGILRGLKFVRFQKRMDGGNIAWRYKRA